MPCSTFPFPARARATGVTALAVAADFPSSRARCRPPTATWTTAPPAKPLDVIEAERRFYLESNTNHPPQRAPLAIAARDRAGYDGARATVQRFINAAHADQIVFTRGTTEAINLVAQSWEPCRAARGRRDPRPRRWSTTPTSCPGSCCTSETGTVLKVVPVSDAGRAQPRNLRRAAQPITQLVAITHVSNALGSINPVTRTHRPRRRCGGAGRRRASRGAPGGGRAGHRLRLLRLLEA
ncbi:aminotransferase class V-fold PLP-dependent enzyme [Thauera humireducens]|uniref:aminotransferase class V-fold PLP-dependent enzyme n=1 Tax=Thauera humireducens TaxID=1134435 RepID=UPI00311F8928